MRLHSKSVRQNIGNSETDDEKLTRELLSRLSYMVVMPVAPAPPGTFMKSRPAGVSCVNFDTYDEIEPSIDDIAKNIAMVVNNSWSYFRVLNDVVITRVIDPNSMELCVVFYVLFS